MYLFREYLDRRFMEAEIPPVPPDLSPEEQQLWSNDSWRKFWLMQHPDYLKSLQTQQPAAPAPKPGLTIGQRPAAFGQKAAARSLGTPPKVAARALTPSYQGASDIGNAVRSYLSGLPGMPNAGSLDELKAVDMGLAAAITQAIQNRDILVANKESDTYGTRGVNFFYGKNNKIRFIINR
jgi:hypothetical protein